MNKLIVISLFFSTLVLLFCNNPVATDEPPLTLVYHSVVGNLTDQKDIIGSGSRNDKEYVVTTKNGHGLWGIVEEIGFYYSAKTVFNGTIRATFEELTGSGLEAQGGLMIRGALRGVTAPYAALRLVNGIYDPVARLDSMSNAIASGSNISFQKGDQLFITCTEKAKTGAVRNIEMIVGADRGGLPLISMKYVISTLSDSLYIGLFGAHRSGSGGTFSVSDLKIK